MVTQNVHKRLPSTHLTVPGEQELVRTVARNLKWLRADKGLSQTEVSFAVGLSRDALSKYEQGARKMLLVTDMLVLCKYYGVSLDELVSVEMEDGDDDEV